MIALIWTLTVILLLAGWLGTLLPLVPGTVLILCAAVGHRLLLGPDQSVSWWTLAGLTLLMLLSHVVDLLSGTFGAKWFGATRWGAIGGIIGGVVGLFFGLPGLLVGPVLGVLIGELLGGKGILPAGKSTWGALLGMAAGIAVKFVIGGVMVAWFLIAAISR